MSPYFPYFFLISSCAPSIAVDLIGGVGCAAGISEISNDYNKVLADLASSNMNAYSSDLTAFETDLFSSVIGCGLTGLGGETDIGGYFD